MAGEGRTEAGNAATARAVGRMLRVSPRKLNLVVREIRGQPVQQAHMRLAGSRRRIAESVRKVLDSAVANAESNHGMNVDQLVVAEAWVGKNLTLRRGRARARGRYGPIRKPFSQVTILLAEESEAEDK